jgi:hypothetical protein
MKALFEFVTIYLILGRRREKTRFSSCNLDVAFEAVQVQLPDAIAGKDSCPVLQYLLLFYILIFIFPFSFSFLSFFLFFLPLFSTNIFFF